MDLHIKTRQNLSGRKSCGRKLKCQLRRDFTGSRIHLQCITSKQKLENLLNICKICLGVLVLYTTHEKEHGLARKKKPFQIHSLINLLFESSLKCAATGTCFVLSLPAAIFLINTMSFSPTFEKILVTNKPSVIMYVENRSLLDLWVNVQFQNESKILSRPT